MATIEDFKNIAKKRLKTAEILMANEEWGMTAYILGFVLECVLKASACKALHLATYPELGKNKNRKTVDYFCTHSFDTLLIISGTSDIFDLSGEGASSWSGFTQEYTKMGNWTDIRYNEIIQFDEGLVRSLYGFLTEGPKGIIPLIEEKNRW